MLAETLASVGAVVEIAALVAAAAAAVAFDAVAFDGVSLAEGRNCQRGFLREQHDSLVQTALDGAP